MPKKSTNKQTASFLIRDIPYEVLDRGGDSDRNSRWRVVYLGGGDTDDFDEL